MTDADVLMRAISDDMTYLLDQIDTGLQIHTEINEVPDDTFLLILLLFQHEHVVVEELLETLVRVVDTQLLKAVELKRNKGMI